MAWVGGGSDGAWTNRTYRSECIVVVGYFIINWIIFKWLFIMDILLVIKINCNDAAADTLVRLFDALSSYWWPPWMKIAWMKLKDIIGWAISIMSWSAFIPLWTNQWRRLTIKYFPRNANWISAMNRIELEFNFTYQLMTDCWRFLLNSSKWIGHINWSDDTKPSMTPSLPRATWISNFFTTLELWTLLDAIVSDFYSSSNANS